MAFIATQTKTVIAYNNLITPANITSITLANATASTTFPVANLKYEDPWRMLKVVSTSNTNPTIDITFAVAQFATCFGYMNHNLGSAPYDVQLSYWNGASYTSVGTTGPLPDNDSNCLLRFAQAPPTTPSTQWRIVLAGNSKPAFYLGALFLGFFYQVSTNVLEGGLNLRLTDPILFEQSAGDAKHVLLGPNKDTAQAEVAFERVDLNMLSTILSNISKRNRRKIIAVIGPEAVSSILPPAGDHFFGYITGKAIAPRQGSAAGQHKADLVLNLEGCI